MRKNLIRRIPMFLFCVLSLLPLQAQDGSSTSTSPVQMTVTVRVLGKNKRMPEVNREDIIVRQGKDRLLVTGWTPLSGDSSPLDLFVLIDDAAWSSVSSQFGDLREFIYSLPRTTSVGVGYMRNGTVRVAQDLTTDHRQATNALRIPLGSPGVYGSPYLSVIDLMKRWPENSNRREIVMITDGVDRLHGYPHSRGLAPMSPDVSSASTVAQRTGTIIHSIYTRGVGWRGSNFWQVTNGQNAMAKLADETGGESFFLGVGEPVSFRPYLDRLQTSLDNRYRLEFNAVPGKKPGLQNVKLTTEVAGVELDSADSVWVAAR
ncbi:MAG: hypothetical protein ABSB39_18070 [Candidatus Sulfotelmatobacter sp.]|jgi:hypothetical protein